MIKGPLCVVCNNEYNTSITNTIEGVCSSSCKITYYNTLLNVHEEINRILEESKI